MEEMTSTGVEPRPVNSGQIEPPAGSARAELPAYMPLATASASAASALPINFVVCGMVLLSFVLVVRTRRAPACALTVRNLGK